MYLVHIFVLFAFLGVEKPLSFTKIAFDNRIYELSWKPPETLNPITNYTIFWCENDKDHRYQCTVSPLTATATEQ